MLLKGEYASCFLQKSKTKRRRRNNQRQLSHWGGKNGQADHQEEYNGFEAKPDADVTTLF